MTGCWMMAAANDQESSTWVTVAIFLEDGHLARAEAISSGRRNTVSNRIKGTEIWAA